MEHLRSGGTRDEKQEGRDGKDESEHFWKNVTHSDYQQRSHGTVALPSGATSFIPTTATGRELGMAACSFVFSRQNYVSFSPKTNSNSWLKSSRLLDYITLLSVSLLPIRKRTFSAAEKDFHTLAGLQTVKLLGQEN